MKNYQVTLVETVEYSVFVHADTCPEAKKLAKEKWANSKTPTVDFDATGFGVTISDAEAMP